MKKWEATRVLDNEGKMLQTINEMGRVGWELVTVVPESEGCCAEAYLKRQIGGAQ